ncbi:MAG: hypothetical protein L0Z70_09915 [Chloroflexi bacterium]|nr:hypothetical protein [Chloroflexota bacterium]
MDDFSRLPAVFQNWQPTQQAASLAFSVGEAAPESLWVMDLPADAQQAAARLEAGEAQLGAADAALAEALARLETLAARSTTGEGALSFAAGAPLDAAEQEALSWLAAAQPGMVSFAVGGPSLELVKEAAERLSGLARSLPRQALHLAWVETRQEGALLARSAVDWNGDHQTLWSAGLSAEECAYHARSLSLAVLSRLTLLRMVAVVVQGAVKLSTLAAVPGGAIMALPAAWQFIQRLLSEAERYQAAARQAQPRAA